MKTIINDTTNSEPELKGIRIDINKNENWVLNPKERVLIRSIIDVIISSASDGVTLTNLYEQVFKCKYAEIQPYKLYQTKYLLMLLWKMGKVKIKRNNGYAIVKWKQLRKV